MYAFLEQARKSVLVVQKNVCRVKNGLPSHQQYTAIKTCDDAQRKREKERRRRDPLSHWQQWDGVERYEDETPSASEE